jgi:drug/metabolite transporter (DMT)-like permease
MSVLAEVPLSKANAFSFLVPIFGLTMGLLYYGESLGWPELIGTSLSLVGVMMVIRKGIAPPTLFGASA